ncbi:MAG: hydrogenase expression/formation C-terminal domain-containing protein [Hyphomicrobium sp.]|jgi:hydrogenase-1 operon protein HyaF
MTGAPPSTGRIAQPEEADDATFDFMEMPKDMRTYAAPLLPEPEEVENIAVALAVLTDVQKATEAAGPAMASRIFDITALDAANRAFVDQALGEGEVSIVAGGTIQVQESVLAGIWRVHETDPTGALLRDFIEVGAFPGLVLDMANASTLEALRPHRGALPAGVLNAPALVTELEDHLLRHRPEDPAHVINLTLLPLSDEDNLFLEERLGPGAVTILSRGYGNCRITSTSTRNAWWVRYFNSRESIVLNTIEVVAVPNVACAAEEDLKDSAQRLGEILEVYR